MIARIAPSKLQGVVKAPSSKSAAHRAVICAGLANGISKIENVGTNEDIIATINALSDLGVETLLSKDSSTVKSKGFTDNIVTIDCNESGSTLRFLTPITAALGISTSFTGKGRLPNRPMEPLLSLLREHGVNISRKQNEIFSISGKLEPGLYSIPGNISSQYITGLLFALPLLDGNSEIYITTPLESSGYVDMTIQMLARFGINIEYGNNIFYIAGNQKYKPQNILVEGDYSGAAFWLAAAALGNNLKISGLSPLSLQADKKILEVLEAFGVSSKWDNNQVSIIPNTLIPTEIDASEIPDSVPILAVVAAYTKGITRIYNAQRLRIKESDRLYATQKNLSAMGANIAQTDDGLIINGGLPLTGTVLDSYNDHRIAMAMSIAALGAEGMTTINNAECVNKSYPEFFRDLKSLGGAIYVI